MSERYGTLNVHVLGTTAQGVELTLIGVQVNIQDASDAGESTTGGSGNYPNPSPIPPALTGPNGLCSFHLPEGRYRATAVFELEQGTSEPATIQVCAGEPSDAT